MSDLGFGIVYTYFDPPEDFKLVGESKFLMNGKMVKDVIPLEPIKIARVEFSQSGDVGRFLEIEMVKDGKVGRMIYKNVTSLTIDGCMINGFFTDVVIKSVFKTEPIDLDHIRIFSDGSVFIYLKNCPEVETHE